MSLGQRGARQMTTPSPFRIDTAFHGFGEAARSHGWLRISDLHEIYWEERGPVGGAPVLVLHGGPGGDIRPYYRRLLDPNRHRGVFFEQRGCGRSRPFGELRENTTWRSVEDIEALREHLGVERWMVVGGSWGSALALAYAETHSERVSALVVSGVFLCRAEDSHWWWEGARAVFPEVYAARDAFLEPSERADARGAFNRRIASGNPDIAEAAATFLSHVESQTLDLWPPTPPEDPTASDPKGAAYGRILSWYDQNDYFFEESQLLSEAARLKGIPGAIVAGRADMCTPAKGAWDLAQCWPLARLSIVPAAGHRWSDEMLGRVLVSEIARLA